MRKMMSKTVIQKIYTDSYTDQLYLQRDTVERLKQYSSEDLSFLDDTRTISLEIDLASEPPILIEEDDDNGKNDGANAELFYESYRTILIDLAFDKKFWVYLTHNNYRSYAYNRFGPKNGDIAEGTVRERFFTQSYSNDRGLERNALSRLWWAAHTTSNFSDESELDYYFKDTDDNYYYTKVLCSSQNLFVQTLGHSFGRSKKILLAALKHTSDNNPKIKDKKAYALFICNRICLYQQNKSLLYTAPEEIMQILKEIAPV